jgi:hypothetical protein
MDDGTVTVIDATGATVTTVAVNSDGSYSVQSIDTAKYVAPFTVKASGTIGAASVVMYALVGSGGIANVTPISHAMAANLAGGDPSALEAGHTKTASQISDLDSAMQTLLSSTATAVGASGSVLTGTYSPAMDKLLDNLVVTTSPSGKTTLSSSLYQSAESDTDNPAALASFNPGTAAAQIKANNAAALKSISAANLISAGDLSYLQSQMTKCFATSANAASGVSSGAGRLTNNGTTPITACSPANFTNNTLVADTNFKHSGYYWMDPAFFSGNTGVTRGINNRLCNNGTTANAVTSGSWNIPFCRGYFGHMLTNPTYDSATFLIPQIVRPFNSAGTQWVVRFPIKFSDGSRDYMGTNIGIEYVVVQKTASANSSTGDTGWRIVGDQRDFPIQAQTNVNRTTNVLNSGYQRWDSSLNFFIGGGFSETDPTHYIKSAIVTGPGLPSSGLTYTNFANNGANPLTSPTSGSNANPLYAPQCGVFTGGAYLALNLPAFNNNGGTSPAACTSQYRLTWVSSTPAYNVDCSRAISKSSYASCNAATNNANISDEAIASAFDGVVGHPYQVVITLGKLSDGSTDGTQTFRTRLHTPPLMSTDLKAPVFNYANFSAATQAAFAQWNGGTGTLPVSWTPFISPRPYKIQLLWNQGAGVLNYGLQGTQIDAGAVSNLSCSSAGISGVDKTDCQNTTNAPNYFTTTNALPTDSQGGGNLNIQARFPSGLNVGSKLSQY